MDLAGASVSIAKLTGSTIYSGSLSGIKAQLCGVDGDPCSCATGWLARKL